MTALVEVSQDSNHWLGTYGPLQVVIWTTGDMSPAVQKRMIAGCKEMARRYRGERPAVISIFCPTLSGPPSAQTRMSIAAMVEAGSDTPSRVAVVYESQGFIAACALSVFSGIQTLLRPHHGYRLFTSVGEGLRWATEHLDEFRSGTLSIDLARMVIERQSKKVRNQLLAQTGAPNVETRP